jgi:hypothetical protein
MHATSPIYVMFSVGLKTDRLRRSVTCARHGAADARQCTTKIPCLQGMVATFTEQAMDAELQIWRIDTTLNKIDVVRPD